MVRKNVYMTEETKQQVEAFMALNNLDNHTEAVRKIVAEHHDKRLEKEKELTLKLNAIDKNVSVLTHLVVFMAESMSASKHDKRLSSLYDEALQARDQEIKRERSHSGLMFNE